MYTEYRVGAPLEMRNYDSLTHFPGIRTSTQKNKINYSSPIPDFCDLGDKKLTINFAWPNNTMARKG